MTKEQFLALLVEELEDYDVPSSSIREIEEEYRSMLEDALENGDTVENFVKRMGSAKKIARTIAKEQPSSSKPNIVALMPFISTAIFFLLGVLANAWHPGWLVFLLIPISSLVRKRNFDYRPLLVFVILIVFILGGTYLNAWSPLWALFLLLFVTSPNQRSLLLQINKMYTLLAIILFVAGVFALEYEWIVVQDASLWIGLAPLVFLPTFILGLATGAIRISIDMNHHRWQDVITHIAAFVALVSMYVLLGIYFDVWHPAWVLFFLIPVYAILRGRQERSLVSFMPFIATTLFVLVGEYVSLPNGGSSYILSWLFFLLIPITGILSSRKR